MQRFGFLYGGYSFQYWETVDMMRKLLIGAIPVFVAVQPQGSLQAVIGQVSYITGPIPYNTLSSRCETAGSHGWTFRRQALHSSHGISGAPALMIKLEVSQAKSDVGHEMRCLIWETPSA